MNFDKVLEDRYSVRKFSSKKVEPEKREAILKAVRTAPTAKNIQPQRFYVVESEDFLKAMKKCTKYTFDAPMIIVVCYDRDESWVRPHDKENGGPTDASIIGTYVMLKVQELGLGTTWVGYFDPAEVRKQLSLPENIVPHAVFPIGYPAEDAEPAPRHFERKPVSEITTYL